MKQILNVADKETLDEVNNKISSTNLNVQGVINDIATISKKLEGEVTPYGTGAYGDVVFDENFTFPSQDGFNRYVIHTNSLIIPEGKTLTPPTKCDGLYIYSKGDVTINGTIDLRGKRKTFGDVQISPTINVGTKTFELAKGGYAPKGGASGEGTYQEYNSQDAQGSPVFTPTKSLSGNINGGGIGEYGIGGCSSFVLKSYNYSYNRWEYSVLPYNDTENGVLDRIKNKFGKIATINQAPGSLVIIAKGKVIVNGNILASGETGVNATAGGTIQYNAYMGNITSDINRNYYFSMSGDGAIPPTGGGCVTIICKQLVNNGNIDTNGKKLVSPNGTDNSSTKNTIQNYLGSISNKNSSVTVDKNTTNTTELSESNKLTLGGEGGKGGTFISTAGEIKVYEGVDE